MKKSLKKSHGKSVGYITVAVVDFDLDNRASTLDDNLT